MITIKELNLRFAKKVIFNNVTVNINSRDRIGVVGSNGMGKTTLFKVLMGLVEVDGGAVDKATFVTLGYLPQDGIVTSGKSLYEEVTTAFESILEVQKHLEDANERLLVMDDQSEDYYDLLDMIGGWEHQLEDLDAKRMKSKIESVLLGLGFSMTDMDRECGEFSGGWQMRIALAKLLLNQPSLLMLDEPTNHLDLPSQRWLEHYLKNYEGAMLIISHDRAFLDELCNRTFEVSLGKLTAYAGNYSYFEEESIHRKELTKRAYVNQQKQLEKTERFINRFRYKSSKAKQVQSRIKALDKVDRVELEDEEAGINFSFPDAPPTGHTVLELKKLCKSYGDNEVYRNLNLRLERGDRVAVVGVNGAGKSTLAKVIAEIEPYDSGECVFGHNVRMSYFAQHQADALDPSKTALEILEGTTTGGKVHHRSVLGAFLFRGDDAFKPVKVLSGGEKCRLALACLMVKKSNFLILDEPTNHLDMRSKTILQNALLQFSGSYLIVSHDRDFLDPIVNKVLEVSKDGTRIFLGNVSEYLEMIEGEEEAQGPARAASQHGGGDSGLSAKERRKLKAERRESLKPLRRKLTALEGTIKQDEAEKAELDKLLVDPDFFTKGGATREKMKRFNALEKSIASGYAEWERLGAEINELSE